MQREFEPLVTIGIPTYNRANRSLRSALKCALGQTYSNLEIVVSDNCSTDHTEDVVGSYRDSRIRYIRHQENIGPANNFNYCANVARGSFFQLFHDDDLIDSDFIETCIDAIAGRPDVGFVRVRGS